MEEIEIWTDIQGYEGLYQISDLGRIKNQDGSIKALPIKKNGYVYASLYKEGKGTTFRVHRLIGLHFIENPLNLPIIHHINSVRSDNRKVNLMWCNNSHNQKEAYKAGRVASKPQLGKFGKDSASSKSISQFTLEGVFIRDWENAYEIKRALDFHPTNIGKCCLCKRQTAHGFIWKFSNNKN